jgi:hypothetical protein
LALQVRQTKRPAANGTIIVTDRNSLAPCGNSNVPQKGRRSGQHLLLAPYRGNWDVCPRLPYLFVTAIGIVFST